jgi:hypothetical protein
MDIYTYTYTCSCLYLYTLYMHIHMHYTYTHTVHMFNLADERDGHGHNVEVVDRRKDVIGVQAIRC